MKLQFLIVAFIALWFAASAWFNREGPQVSENCTPTDLYLGGQMIERTRIYRCLP